MTQPHARGMPTRALIRRAGNSLARPAGFELATRCSEGRFRQGVKLLLSWWEPVRSSSAYSSVSLVSASFWHAAGTDSPLDANYWQRGQARSIWVSLTCNDLSSSASCAALIILLFALVRSILTFMNLSSSCRHSA